jgi:hypothetical protein
VEKRYYANIRLEFGYSFDAKNKKEAIEYLKDNFKDDYGIDLKEYQIIKLEEEEYCMMIKNISNTWKD